MASILRIKRSETGGNPSVLGAGELAYSGLADSGSNGGDRLYSGMGTETAGNAVNHVIIGGKRYTDMVDAATSVKTNNTIVKRNGAGAAYLDVFGNLTGNVTGNITSTGTSSFTGISTTGGTIDGTIIGGTTAAAITGTTITATTGFVGTFTGDVSGNITGTTGTFSSLTSGRLTFAGANGLLTDDGDLTYNGTTNTISAGNITLTGNVTANVVTGGTVKASSLTTGRITFAGADGLLSDDSDLTYNSTTNTLTVPTVTGNLVGKADTADKWHTARNLSLTGDATATLSAVDGSGNVSTAITLATVNTNVGTYGSATDIPVVTVNGKGLVTAVSTVSVATNLSIQGDSGTDLVGLLTDTLKFKGGSGVATSVTNNEVTISLVGSQSITNLDTTSLNAGSAVITGTLSAGNTSVADLNVSGNVVIAGNLTVNGQVTAVNSTTVTIVDKNLELANNANTAILADGGGVTVGKTLSGFTAATLTYSALDNRWNFNKDLNVANVYAELVGNASTATALKTARNLSLTGDATTTLTGFDGTANLSSVLTLATVNANVGTFGDSVTVPTFTVNAKGLITAASQTAIPYASTSVKGLSSFDSSQFTVTSGAVTLAQIDGGTY